VLKEMKYLFYRHFKGITLYTVHSPRSTWYIVLNILNMLLVPDDGRKPSSITSCVWSLRLKMNMSSAIFL